MHLCSVCILRQSRNDVFSTQLCAYTKTVAVTKKCRNKFTLIQLHWIYSSQNVSQNFLSLVGTLYILQNFFFIYISIFDSLHHNRTFDSSITQQISLVVLELIFCQLISNSFRFSSISETSSIELYQNGCFFCLYFAAQKHFDTTLIDSQDILNKFSGLKITTA